MGVMNWRAACIIDKVVRAGEGGDPSRPNTFLATQTSCNLLQLSAPGQLWTHDPECTGLALSGAAMTVCRRFCVSSFFSCL